MEEAIKSPVILCGIDDGEFSESGKLLHTEFPVLAGGAGMGWVFAKCTIQLTPLAQILRRNFLNECSMQEQHTIY